MQIVVNFFCFLFLFSWCCFGAPLLETKMNFELPLNQHQKNLRAGNEGYRNAMEENISSRILQEKSRVARSLDDPFDQQQQDVSAFVLKRQPFNQHEKKGQVPTLPNAVN